MRKFLDIMRVDLMTMNGGKNSTRTLLIFVFIGSIAGELFLSPMFGFIGLLMVGAMTVPIAFTSHMKYHSEKMFGLLPISRKELVQARFIMFVALYLAMALVMYVFMELSLALKIYAELTVDIEKVLASMGLGIAYNSLCRLAFFIFFAFGMIAVGSGLKGYFTDPDAYAALMGAGTKMKKMKTRDVMIFLAFFAALILFFLFASGTIPLSAGLAVVVQLFAQLFTVADGVLFGTVMIALSGFSAMYSYVCTVIEYEDKDI